MMYCQDWKKRSKSRNLGAWIWGSLFIKTDTRSLSSLNPNELISSLRLPKRKGSLWWHLLFSTWIFSEVLLYQPWKLLKRWLTQPSTCPELGLRGHGLRKWHKNVFGWLGKWAKSQRSPLLQFYPESDILYRFPCRPVNQLRFTAQGLPCLHQQGLTVPAKLFCIFLLRMACFHFAEEPLTRMNTFQ